MATSSPSAVREGAVSPARWSPAEAAEYAARREFLLLQLLATDRDAFRVARRLGVFARGAAAKSGLTLAAAQARRATEEGAASSSAPRGDAPRKPNSKQRRSAARAAAHRAAQAAAAGARAPPPAQTPAAAPAADVAMAEDEALAPSAPPSPRREEGRLLREASYALAARRSAARS